jgi:nitric oxide reductase subunit B
MERVTCGSQRERVMGGAMTQSENAGSPLSPWWRNAAILVMIFGFSVLIWVAARSYEDAPPIPARVVSITGETLFTRADIVAGQQVFLRYALMENGTVWGHGAYLGPDFSAAYLHALSTETGGTIARRRFDSAPSNLTAAERKAVAAETGQWLKENRYDPHIGALTFTPPEAATYRKQIGYWAGYFSKPTGNGGLPAKYITDPEELRQLTAFFAWTAWASVANRPGKPYSYTNNFPYDPASGNTPTSEAVLWSALSLITLLAGTAAVLFAFGKFDFLGWQRKEGEHVHPQMLPGVTTASQRATLKYFVVVALLFLAQALVGGATVHYRVDPASF